MGLPKFEEGRARELIRFGTDVRTWEADEDPGQTVAQILEDLGIATGRIGIEERVRFFLFDMIRRAVPALEYVLADSVTAGCRVIKSPAEIALMQRANDITIAAYVAAIATLRAGEVVLMDGGCGVAESLRFGTGDPFGHDLGVTIASTNGVRRGELT